MTTADPPRRWRGGPILDVGEAMVEFAPVGESLYRRGFAGDTLNTAQAAPASCVRAPLTAVSGRRRTFYPGWSGRSSLGSARSWPRRAA